MKKKNELKALKEERADFKNRWKRAVADYQNLEKRVAREREELIRSANFSLFKKIIPLKDSLEKAARNIADEGLALVLRQFEKILKDEGVGEIEALGKKFDPRFHECVEVVKGGGDGQVVEVATKGYKIGEKIIRPAKVKIGGGSRCQK